VSRAPSAEGAAEVGEALLEAVRAIAREAGRAITRIEQAYRGGDAGALDVQTKADASPLTAADLAAHRIILAGLAALRPQWPVVSEEGAQLAFEERRHWRRFWLVDPLDGTREFLSGNGEYTVNIALIEDGAPRLGVVLAPATGLEYSGLADGGAWRARGGAAQEAIRVAGRLAGGAALRLVGSRSHRGDSLDALLACIGPHEFVPMGSSLKFCVLAEGGADVYPRLGPTSEWDTAAGHAVLLGAGGRVMRLDGTPLRYNRHDGWLNPEFIACGDAEADWPTWLREHGG
jgi:3'(2'), 5'-bisphosphate nucleotidase